MINKKIYLIIALSFTLLLKHESIATEEIARDIVTYAAAYTAIQQMLPEVPPMYGEHGKSGIFMGESGKSGWWKGGDGGDAWFFGGSGGTGGWKGGDGGQGNIRDGADGNSCLIQ